MKLLKYVFSISILFLLYGCPDVDEIDSTIYIKNNSDKDIYFVGRGDEEFYPWAPSENRLILSNTVFFYKGSFKESLLDGSILYIWLFDREVIDNTPWKEVVANEMYLIRYELTIQNLEAMNWEIVYTGE